MFGCKGLNHMFLFTIQFSASENERRKGNLGTLCRSCKYNVLCACIVHLHWVMVILLLLKKLKTVRGPKLILVRIFFSVSFVVYYDEHIYLQGGLHCKYQGICNSHKQIKLLLAIFYQAGPVQLQAGFDGGLKSCLLFIWFLNLCLEFAFSKEGGYSTWVWFVVNFVSIITNTFPKWG